MAEPWTDGDVLTATHLAGLPWGVMGYAPASAAQAGISAAVDLTSCTVTFTAISSRVYVTVLHIGRMDQSVSTGIMTATITDAANTELRRCSQTNTAGSLTSATVILIETGLSGSITRKGRLTTSAGTISTIAGSNNLPMIAVFDLAL